MNLQELFYQIAIIGKRDLPLAPDPRSGAEMTLLRMLAFRPADTAPAEAVPPVQSGSRQQASAARSDAAHSANQDTAKAGPAAAWQEPDWSALLPSLSLGGATRLLAGNCAYLERIGDTVHLSLDPTFEAMLTKARAQAIAEALSTHFGEALKVDIAVGKDGPETPHQAETRQADESMAAARQSLENDPNVRTLQSLFDAELKPDSIEIIPGSGRD